MDAQEKNGVEDIWQSAYTETGKLVLEYSTRKKERVDLSQYVDLKKGNELKKRFLSNTQHTRAEDFQQQYRAKTKAVKRSEDKRIRRNSKGK